jgi:hypothetical protein
MTTLEKNASPETCTQTLERGTENKYVALMETNGKECESWYYFIKYEGNEENLKHLWDQLESVDWYVLDDLSVFDLDLDHFVSAKTAKEMTKLELNSYAFHRKFDGVLKRIDLGFKKKDKTEKKIGKAFDLLSYGQIEDYIDEEDLDSEDLTENESDEDEETSEESSSEEETETPRKSRSEDRPKGIPPALLKSERPNWAKAKGKKNHRPL